jgi:hypothetical protein
VIPYGGADGVGIPEDYPGANMEAYPRDYRKVCPGAYPEVYRGDYRQVYAGADPEPDLGRDR